MASAEPEERASRVHKRSKPYRSAARSLGLRVRGLRQARGWTLQEAAERMDLDWKHLQKIEAGTLNVTLVTLVRLAEGFGEPLAALFIAPTGRAAKAR